ncbi:arginase family protein [Cryobacterium sp. CG_9.6]|uniref:arginase family protein n=1 Tax=Cryobacterium sp. CG_9.6 TaxID=2760710 RepID=UPI0024732D05|nr:arginase family protein [Cryobacterium sp. CG_9.6]MDH6237588.1 arginase [Cryobacterium sp. CG_9.6]
MRLVDGAAAIQGDLPASATREVDVPVEAGDGQDTGIHRFSSVQIVRERQSLALRATSDWALTIGGDCGVSLAAVEHASHQHPHDVALLWFSAHPELHTPDTSPSGGFCGMVLRAIAGEGHPDLSLDDSTRIPFDHIVLVGARDADIAESDLIAERNITQVDVEELDTPDALLAAIQATGASTIYVHISLDVLDPSALLGLADLVPFGLSVPALTSAITAVRAAFPVVGASIVGFSPASPAEASDDLPSILRVIGALTR